MNLYQFEFDLPLYAWLICVVLCVFIVHFFYKKTKPITSKIYIRILIVVRSVIVISLLSLIFHPLIKSFESKSVNNTVQLLIDKSTSMNPYLESLDSLQNEIEADLESKNIDFKTSILNENENYSDFVSPLSKLKVNSNDITILLTDGNQTSDNNLKQSYTNKLLILPVGKKNPNNHISIDKINVDKEIYSLKEIQNLNVLIRAFRLQETESEIKLTINNNEILKKKISLYNGLNNIDLKNSINSRDSIFNLLIEINDVTFKTKIYLSNTKKRILHLFDQPNIEAKFIKFALKKNNEVDINSINIASYNNRYIDDIDFIILSGDLSNVALIRAHEGFIKKKVPVLLITEKDFRLPYLGLNKVEFHKTANSAKIKVNPKTYSSFLSFYRTGLFHFSEFPDLDFAPIKNIEISNKLEYKAYFQSKNSDFLILFRNKKSKNIPITLVNSMSFWKYHLSMTNDLEKKNNYSDLLNYIYKSMISDNKNLIKSNIKAKNIISFANVAYDIESKYEDESSIEFDFIDVKVFNEKKQISSSRFPFNALGTYQNTIEVPEKGRLNFQFKSYLNGIEQFKKSETFEIQTRDNETRNPYINDLFLEVLAEKNNISIINKNDFKKNIISVARMETQSNIIKLYFNKTLLYVLLTLIALEWFLRKQKQLL